MNKRIKSITAILGAIIVILAAFAFYKLAKTMQNSSSAASSAVSSLVSSSSGASSVPSVSSSSAVSSAASSAASSAPAASSSAAAVLQPVSFYETLDNTLAGWGVGYAKNQVTPQIPKKTMDQFKKYDAFYAVQTAKKIIYLTIDEGYEAGYTPKILDTLKEKNVKAVFFVTTPYVKGYPDNVRRMISEGHTVGNHSTAHKSFPSLTIQAMEDDVTTLHNLMLQQFNYKMNFFRFPSGEHSERTLAVLHDLGYKSLFWSFAYMDYDQNNQPDPTEAYNKITASIHPGEIMLVHAVSKTNSEIIGQVIDYARSQGYEFAPDFDFAY